MLISIGVLSGAEANCRDEFWDVVRADIGLDSDVNALRREAVSGEITPCVPTIPCFNPPPPAVLEDSTQSSYVPRQRQIIPWGSDASAFSNRQRKVPRGHNADPHPTATAPPAVVERSPYLRQYRLAYNTVNNFIYCENPGKVGGVCCAGLPINQVFKHLTQTAVRASSDCIVHGYKIMPAQKAALERELQELYPDAPFTPADLQSILPLKGQVGPVVGIAPPVPGYICPHCGRGYTTPGAARAHWRDIHPDVEKPNGKCYVPVPQMQSLSLHVNFIRYFPIVPGPAVETNGPAFPTASSDDMTLLSALQEDAFGPDDGIVELDLDAVLAFFRNAGATDHVKGFSPNELRSLVGSPREDEPKLVKLRRSQGLRFEAHCQRIVKGSPALRRLIVTTKP